MIAAVLRELIAAGLHGEDLVAAIERIETAIAEKAAPARTLRQARNARYYQGASEKRLKSSYSVDSDAPPPPSSFPESKSAPRPPEKTQTLSPAPTPPISPPPLEKPLSAVDEIWAISPKQARQRSGKAALERALGDAFRKGHSATEIRQGLIGYYASDDATKDGAHFAKGVHSAISEGRWQAFVEPVSNIRNERLARWGHDEWRTALKVTAERGYWGDQLGPAPGQPGCLVPPELLASQEGAEVLPFPHRATA